MRFRKLVNVKRIIKHPKTRGSEGNVSRLMPAGEGKKKEYGGLKTLNQGKKLYPLRLVGYEARIKQKNAAQKGKKAKVEEKGTISTTKEWK